MFRAQMYALREFPPSLRSGFILKEDPYEDMENEYLKELGVVFYRDENHAYGVIIPETDDPEESLVYQSGWQAYKFDIDLFESEEGFEVEDWPEPKREGELKQKYRKLVRKNGDAKAWLIWNKPVVILKMEDISVTVG